MPWSVKRHPSCEKNKPWGVVKDDGSLISCHRRRNDAIKHQRALYSSEKDMNEENEIVNRLSESLVDAIGEILDDDEIEDKYESIVELTEEYKDCVQQAPKHKSIFSVLRSLFVNDGDPYELKVAMKRENGIDYPSADYAYVPDAALPGTWKLRLTEEPGKLSLAQLGRAAAAISPGGFRGQKAQIPESALSSVKRRIRAAYRMLGVSESDIPQSVKKSQLDSNLHLWKDTNGQYNFVAIYSNNIRDDDHPAEILSEKSHQRFEQAVKLGIFDPPELWLWHIPGTRWGKASHIMSVDGFAVALGTVDAGYEQIAELLMSNKSLDIALSHGMPNRYIVRSKQDPTIIDFYVSTEISVLPRRVAANKFTGFSVFSNKENHMPLTDDQRTFLQQVGLPSNVIDGLDNLNALGKEAEEQGRERKEAEPSPVESAPVEQVREEPAVTKQEIAESLSQVLTPLIDSIKSIAERLASVEAQLSEVKSKPVIDEDMTPKSSMTDLLRASIFGETSAARVKDNDPIVDQKPVETEAPKESYTGVQFLDGIISRSYTQEG